MTGGGQMLMKIGDVINEKCSDTDVRSQQTLHRKPLVGCQLARVPLSASCDHPCLINLVLNNILR